jgi:hypothetical protein
VYSFTIIRAIDIFWSIILVAIILAIGKSIQSKHIQDKPYYKNYVRGLQIKIFGGVLFCLIYALYYGGGDTTNYFQGIYALNKVFWNDPIEYIIVLFNDGDSPYPGNAFWSVQTYPPIFMLKDPRTYLVMKIGSILSIPAINGFLPTTILLAAISYKWIWKIYEFIVLRYPDYQKEVNITILFLPSTVFWGSGIMKDTFTFAATCYAVYGLHELIVERKVKLANLIQLYFAIYLIITMKSYILLALLPGLLIFANFERLKKIQNPIVRILLFPVISLVIFIVLNTIIGDGGDAFGKYSADRVFEEAAIQNNDLKRDVYGGNNFDIGEFAPTPTGVLSIIIPALNAALFRPYLWEVGSPTMLFAALENAIVNVIFFLAVFSGLGRMLKFIGSDPFFLMTFLFTILLGFGIGISTANFGALVRYKIPLMPFFIFMILVARKNLKKTTTT